MSRRIRLCMKDLYHQDVVEMIERETRKYELHVIEEEDHPDFQRAFQLLWDCFGPHGEMEREESIRAFLRDDPTEPAKTGTFFKYFLLVAKDKDGNLRGVRDGTILVNPAYAPDLCVVYLSHIYMLPEARGTVLSYWLRIAPVELAVQYLADLHTRGRLKLPEPNAPGRYFGMRMNLAAEMEYWTPEDRLSLQRILFYGRGGFDVINPRHFPYRQPDFRPPEEIAKTGVLPVPFMILLRRMGRERQAALPIEEAEAVMRLLYDDFAEFCLPEHLHSSLDLVLRRLEERRSKGKTHVELLPLPTGPKDLHRLKRIFRYNVYKSYYPDAPETRAYLEGGIREKMKNPRFLDEELAAIARALDGRPHFVYGNRDKEFTWEGAPVPVEHDPPEGDITMDVAITRTIG
ncbi:MAG: hypothetical protein ACOZNI_05135 [Myxococcota bacterium]